jgi:hypothetical protein
MLSGSLWGDYAPGTILLLLVTAAIAGLARGFSGFGAALIFVPLGSAAIGPQLAVPLILLIDAVMALGLIPAAWRQADRACVGMMTIGAVIGIPLGTLALAWLDPLVVRWAIAALVVALLLLLISGWRYHGKPKTLFTIGVGGVSGLFSGAAQVGGPPVVAYWLGGAIPMASVRANIVLYFAVSSVLTIASYLVGGLFAWPILVLALVTGPCYGAGLYIGSRLFDRTNETAFRRLSYILIAMAAILGLPILDPILR